MYGICVNLRSTLLQYLSTNPKRYTALLWNRLPRRMFARSGTPSPTITASYLKTKSWSTWWLSKNDFRCMNQINLELCRCKVPWIQVCGFINSHSHNGVTTNSIKEPIAYCLLNIMWRVLSISSLCESILKPLMKASWACSRSTIIFSGYQAGSRVP